MGFKVKVRGQGQISKVKIEGRNAVVRYFDCGTAPYTTTGGSGGIVRRVKGRVSVRNTVGGSLIFNRRQFHSFTCAVGLTQAMQSVGPGIVCSNPILDVERSS